jgi:hypothetical protein
VHDAPTQASGVRSFDRKFIRSARDDFAADAKTAYRRISPIVVKSCVPILRRRNEQEVEVAVGPVGPFGPTAKQPNFNRIDLFDQLSHDSRQSRFF